MSLKNLVDDSRTNKDTTHSYLDLYDKLLLQKKETATCSPQGSIAIGWYARIKVVFKPNS